MRPAWAACPMRAGGLATLLKPTACAPVLDRISGRPWANPATQEAARTAAMVRDRGWLFTVLNSRWSLRSAQPDGPGHSATWEVPRRHGMLRQGRGHGGRVVGELGTCGRGGGGQHDAGGVSASVAACRPVRHLVSMSMSLRRSRSHRTCKCHRGGGREIESIVAYSDYTTIPARRQRPRCVLGHFRSSVMWALLAARPTWCT
jgi:hypothetical protein